MDNQSRKALLDLRWLVKGGDAKEVEKSKEQIR
jgi:hypothetical protein